MNRREGRRTTGAETRRRYLRWGRIGVTIAVVAYLMSRVRPGDVLNAFQRLSGGAAWTALTVFSLGLGPQVRAHIEKRFGAPASRPSARMRDFVRALRAIWACWNDGMPLHYEGEFYRHTLMTPMFNPGASPHGPPPVLLAGVGPAMTRVAAEVADGIVLHPFHTRRFLDQVTLPAIEIAPAPDRASDPG